MNKINNIGLKLIQYKDEFAKDYPEIVRESMNIALNQMIDTGELDRETYDFITNTKGRKTFHDYLSNHKSYRKSKEELRQEFEKLKTELVEIMRLHQIEEVEVETAVEKDAILVVKSFEVDEDFVMDYFGVGEKELIKLMKKGGFIEAFVSLRLARVLTFIIEDCSPGMSHIVLYYSLPYLNKNGSGYSVDLLMEINVDDFEKVEYRNRIIGEIKEVSERSDTVFFQKMVI